MPAGPGQTNAFVDDQHRITPVIDAATASEDGRRECRQLDRGPIGKIGTCMVLGDSSRTGMCLLTRRHLMP